MNGTLESKTNNNMLENNGANEVAPVLPFNLNENRPPFPLHALVHSLVQTADSNIKLASEKIETMNNEDRKNYLYKHFVTTREQFLRLLVLIRWSQQRLDLLAESNQQSTMLEGQMSAFMRSADYLHFVDDSVKSLREPVFDVPTAIDVATTGTYNRLPFCIQSAADPLQQPEQAKIETSDVNKAVQRLTDMIRMKLLQERLPQQLKVKHVEHGQLILHAYEKDEFEMVLTLVPHSTPAQSQKEFVWRILHLNLLVNEIGVKVSPLFKNRVDKLKYILQKRIFDRVSPTPLVDVYLRTHEVCTRVAMDILSKQCYQLQKQHMTGVIVYEFVQEENTNGEVSLFVYYWSNPTAMDIQCEGKSLTSFFAIESKQYPNYGGKLNIFVDSKNEILVHHEPILLNQTPDMWQFKLSALNLSDIIMKAMNLQIKERLIALRNYLLSSAPAQVLGDDDAIVVEKEGNDCLLIYLVDSYFLGITINWKTGQFKLQFLKDGSTFAVNMVDTKEDNAIPLQHYQLLNLDTFEVLLNKSLSQSLKVICSIKKNLLLYLYFRAATLLGVESFDHRYFYQIKVQYETEDEQAMLSDSCLYIRFPQFPRSYMAVSMISSSTDDNMFEILSRNFKPIVHLLYETGKLKRYAIFKTRDDLSAALDEGERPKKRARITLPPCPYQHLCAIIQHYSAFICKCQLLNLLTQRGITYDHQLGTQGEKAITFPFLSQFNSLVQTYPASLVALHQDVLHPIAWYTEFVVQRAAINNDALPLLIDNQLIDKMEHNGPNEHTVYAPYYDVKREQSTLHSNMSYIVNTSSTDDVTSIKIRLNYAFDGVPQAIPELLLDLKAIDSMTLFMNQITEYQKKNNFFKIVTFTHSLIVLEYGLNYKLYLFYEDRKQLSIALHPPCPPVKLYVEQVLVNNQDFNKLALCIENVVYPCYVMLSSLSPSWVCIGRNLVNVRLIYKQPKYEFSVQFSPKGALAIEAVGTSPQRFQMNVLISDLESMKNAFTQLDLYAKAYFVFDMLTQCLSHTNLHSVVKHVQREQNKFQFTVQDMNFALAVTQDPYDFTFNVLPSSQLTDSETIFLSQFIVRQCNIESNQLFAERFVFSIVKLFQCPIATLKLFIQIMNVISSRDTPNTVEIFFVIPADLRLPKKIEECAKEKVVVPGISIFKCSLTNDIAIMVRVTSALETSSPIMMEDDDDDAMKGAATSNNNRSKHRYVDLPILYRGNSQQLQFVFLPELMNLGSNPQIGLQLIQEAAAMAAANKTNLLISVIEKLKYENLSKWK